MENIGHVLRKSASIGVSENYKGCKTTQVVRTQVVRAHCSRENIRHMRELKGVVSLNTPLEWPKNSQPDEYYINEEGTYELVFSSQQQKTKAFSKYC